MKKENNKEIEEFLSTFSLKTGPPTLKNKILEGVHHKQKSDLGMTVFLRKGFIVCLLILTFVIAIDAAITGAQNRRISSLLDKRQESTDKSEEEWSILKDIIGEPFDSNKYVMGKILSGFLEKSGTGEHLPEWRESFKKELE